MTDVLVVGAGAVGLYAAAAFATAGFDVELWEKREAPVPGASAQSSASPSSGAALSRAAPSSRAIGIHPPALHALDAIGVADAVAAEAVQVRRAQARVSLSLGTQTAPSRVGTVSFDQVSRRFPFVATLPQHRTQALIEEKVLALGPGASGGTITVSRGIEVVGIAPHVRGVTVRGTSVSVGGPPSQAGATQIEARFVVIAEGAGGMSRRRLGVPTSDRAYRDTYLMGDAADTTGDGEEAVVTLSPDGVVESFPLPGGVRRFVAHTPLLLPDAGPDTLSRLVATRTGHRFDPSTVTMLSAFGVRRRIARRFVVGTRIAIVGDAAHEISPIGGQGMNLGWLDVAELVPVVAALLSGRSDGSPVDDLAAWGERRRRIATAAARQAELNMRVSAPGSTADLRLRSLALGAALRGGSGARLARVYAMGSDPPRVR